MQHSPQPFLGFPSTLGQGPHMPEHRHVWALSTMSREMKCQTLRKRPQTYEKKELNEPSQCLFIEMLELCVLPFGGTRKFLHQLLHDRAQAELILHLPPDLVLGCIPWCHHEKCFSDSVNKGTNKTLEHDLPAVGFAHFSFLFAEVSVGCGILE